MSNKDACICDPCDCDVPPVSAGDACVCANPPCDCGLPKDECVCKPCECDLPEDVCGCDPCICETPPGSPKNPPASPQGFCDPFNAGRGFTLNEFIRAKEYFLTTSTNSGLNMYDHMSEVLRKMLDSRAPPNCVDFLEELSLNIKRYRFGMPKDLLRDAYYLSPPVVEDAASMISTWRQHAQWSKYQLEEGEEISGYGGFPNLMRLLYYLEQVNIGLPREEMFRIALAQRQLNLTRPIKRSRFWGKIFGLEKNYYVIEAELTDLSDEGLWTLGEPATVPAGILEGGDAKQNFITGTQTYDRARSAVTDPKILIPYQETSGLPPGPLNCVGPTSTAVIPGEYGGEGYGDGPVDTEAATEAELWASYQKELMEGFPAMPKLPEEVIVPAEQEGQGVNRRAYYVTNELNEKWVLLPLVTPKQIQVSRNIRRFLTGRLDATLEVYPEFDGREAHYLKALLARITAGTQVSPKGYFRRRPQPEDEEEEEEEDVDEEEEDFGSAGDILFAVTKYMTPPMPELLTQPPAYWVHHVSNILKQGRVTWWNPAMAALKYDEELGEEEEEPEVVAEREFGPILFSSLGVDISLEGWNPWSPRASSTVFTEFQIASVRSNIWPGASAFCTYKGKVENVYFGDGMKFRGICYAPPVPVPAQTEYKDGPELTEVNDPTYKQEEEWLLKMELEGLNDVEEKFVDNEVSDEVEEEEATSEDDED